MCAVASMGLGTFGPRVFSERGHVLLSCRGEGELRSLLAPTMAPGL